MGAPELITGHEWVARQTMRDTLPYAAMIAAALQALSVSLLFWERAGYVFTCIVIAGCIGEFIADFTRIPKTDSQKHSWSKWSLLALTFGIAGELLSAVRSSQISSSVIADLQASVANAKSAAISAADAARIAQSAADIAANTAGAAEQKAAKSQIASNQAERTSITARKSAGNARTTANGALMHAGFANQEAVTATKQAVEVKTYLDALANSVNPRLLQWRPFLETLSGKTPGRVQIWYEPDDLETEIFATELFNALGPDGAKWQVDPIRAFPQPLMANAIPYSPEKTPLLQQERIEAYVNSTDGIAVTGRNFESLDDDGRTTLGALRLAIKRGLQEASDAHIILVDPTLSDNEFVVVVTHHRANMPIYRVPWRDTPKSAQTSATEPKMHN